MPSCIFQDFGAEKKTLTFLHKECRHQSVQYRLMSHTPNTMTGDLQFGSFTMNVVIGLVMTVAGSYYVYAKTATNRRPLPPGPKGWPVIGNINDLPPPGVREWEFWYEHKDKYGE